jgi:hypothetical protein
MGPVDGPESVLDKEVGQPRQVSGQVRIVFGLAGFEAGVLEEDHLPGKGIGHRPLDRRTHDLIKLSNRKTAELRKASGNRIQGKLGFPVLGSTQMAAYGDLGPGFSQTIDGFERCHDAKVVADFTVVERNVEVGPDQDPPVDHFEIVQSEITHWRRP